jgi:hypothetical protein
MGLQARPETRRMAHGLRQPDAEGTMADNNRESGTPRERGAETEDEVNREDLAEDRDVEREQIRSSNDRDQALEREGVESRHNRGYDEAVRGAQSAPVDPDSAASDVDRDDTVGE